MGNLIKLKRSATPGNVPAALDVGEVAINEADGVLFWRDGAGVVQAVSLKNTPYVTIPFVFDGGGAAITPGFKGVLPIDFPCVILGWTLLGEQAGSIVIDVWKDTFANAPLTAAASITAAAKPTISDDVKAQSTTLTGWTTAIAAGDVLAFNVDSASTLEFVTLGLKVRKT
ncbi:hypothetical protein [Phenylobacterium sp.]|uniref:hypothetical protein n=1 Tax=Phenylobacterium sp. TaxID=1871053 RepID=UPI0035B24F7B